MNDNKEQKQLSGYADFQGFCKALQEHVLLGWRVSEESPSGWANHVQYHIFIERDIPEDVVIEAVANKIEDAMSGI